MWKVLYGFLIFYENVYVVCVVRLFVEGFDMVDVIF